jgi:hypothetical protein
LRAFHRALSTARSSAGHNAVQSVAVNLVSTANTPARERSTWSTSSVGPNGTLSMRVQRFPSRARTSMLHPSPSAPTSGARAPLASTINQAMPQPETAMPAPSRNAK